MIILLLIITGIIIAFQVNRNKKPVFFTPDEFKSRLDDRIKFASMTAPPARKRPWQSGSSYLPGQRLSTFPGRMPVGGMKTNEDFEQELEKQTAGFDMEAWLEIKKKLKRSRKHLNFILKHSNDDEYEYWTSNETLLKTIQEIEILEKGLTLIEDEKSE